MHKFHNSHILIWHSAVFRKQIYFNCEWIKLLSLYRYVQIPPRTIPFNPICRGGNNSGCRRCPPCAPPPWPCPRPRPSWRWDDGGCGADGGGGLSGGQPHARPRPSYENQNWFCMTVHWTKYIAACIENISQYSLLVGNWDGLGDAGKGKEDLWK